MSKFKSVEGATFIAGLLIIFLSVHKAIVNELYDPIPNIITGVSIMTGGWLAPTKKIDEKIEEVLPDKKLIE